jgi:hypothetical protein
MENRDEQGRIMICLNWKGKQVGLIWDIINLDYRWEFEFEDSIFFIPNFKI